MRGALFAFSLLASAAVAAPGFAAPSVFVYPEHSVRLPISGATGSVIVGDPTIADVLVVDRHTVFVQGKSVGQTQVVVVDTGGRTIWQGEVAVVAADEGHVTMIRAGQVTDLTCAGRCTNAPVKPGGAVAVGTPSPSVDK